MDAISATQINATPNNTPLLKESLYVCPCHAPCFSSVCPV